MMSLIKSSKEFSFLTSIRQQRHNAGTIFAFSYGRYQSRRYLEIQSSGRQDVLRIHYSPISRKMSGTSSGVRVETFPLRLADDSWHRLGVIVSGDQIEVLLDCQTVHRRVVPGIDTSFLLPTMTTISLNSNQEQGNLTAWLGQRNQDNFLFKVNFLNFFSLPLQFNYFSSMEYRICVINNVSKIRATFKTPSW